MIAADQPTIFGKSIIAAISSKKDGNMKFDIDGSKVTENRQKFLRGVGIDMQHTSLVGVTYDTDNFAKYNVATVEDKGNGMLDARAVRHADALVVDQPGHALFLLLADCVGAILYDDGHHVLMMSHLGRHSVEIDGAAKSVRYLVRHYSTNPSRLQVWLSPGVGKATYPLRAFGGKSLHEVITMQLLSVGVQTDNIENGGIDTAHNEQYYSHSQYLKGDETQRGRFAIVAQMREAE